jgi:hypothetical protein
MAEEAPATTNNDWNLDAARRLLRAFTVSPIPSDGHNIPTDTAVDEFDVSAYDPTASKPTSLGDFDRLWRFRGVPTGTHPHRSRHGSTESSSSSTSAGSTAPSSAPEIASDGADGIGGALDTDEAIEVEDFSDFVHRNKAVRWKDEISGLELSTTRRRSAAPSAADVDVEKLSELIQMEDTAFDNILYHNITRQNRGELSAGNCTTPTFHMTLRSAKKHGLIPAILPAAPPSLPLTPPSYLDTRLIQPLLTLTATEKKALLVRKLREKKLLAQDFDASLAVARWGENVRSDGIHVFVDLSNINIGFFNELKKLRGIGKGNSPKMPPIAFHSLAFILERNRPVSRRVLAGSHGGLMHGHRARRPDHMYDAEKCGYEMNILEPVFKVKSIAPVRKNRNGTGNGYATTSGHSSGSDAPIPGTQVRQEQCVDEILQMKMLESLVDVEEPSTLVLASGDGAEAEYSGGFLKMVERFLRKGWNVELFAWSDGLSMEYRSKSFASRWNGRFRVIELDDFSEVLLAMYADAFSGSMRAAL